MKLLTVVTSYSVFREGDSPIFGNTATHVRVDDDTSGPYLVLEQKHEDPGRIHLDLEELEAIVVAARKLMKQKLEQP
jgi:hypothetical protein